MPRNIEIKARLADPAAVRRGAEMIADGPPLILDQEDRFFAVPAGRLKLRILAGEKAELIAYARPDARGPRASDYRIAAVEDPERMTAVLSAALGGVRTVVRKRRTLFMRGRTRIHLDEVEGLGFFLELEVVLAEGEDDATGAREAHDLMERLGVTSADLVREAYVDLLAAPTDSQ